MKILLCLAVLLLYSTANAQAPRKLQLEEGANIEIKTKSKLVLPPGYDPQKSYPLVVFMPFTGGSGTDMLSTYAYQSGNYSGNSMGGGGYMEFNLSPLIDSLKRMPTDKEVNDYMDKLIKEKQNSTKEEDTGSKSEEEKYLEAFLKGVFGSEINNKSFIAMLPDGIGSTADHNWKGFSACIHRYETRILQDIESYSANYKIDKNNIILIGYSLGGDLSWAITNRYPEKFKGAIISGSRCGYAEKGMIERLAKKNARYYIAMGEHESDARMKGAKYAQTRLNTSKIANKFELIKEAGHDPTSFSQLKDAFNFVLFE